MLKSKIHGATVTETQLQYEGSITVDVDLLSEADILPGEQVQVLNLNNGQRFITYAIAAPAKSATVILNGPAARLGEVGDQVLILSYASYDDTDARTMEPVIVYLNDENQPETGHPDALGVADTAAQEMPGTNNDLELPPIDEKKK